jgi:two-component system, NtrC family, response regulator HydG
MHASPSPTVLVVDDDVGMVETLADILREHSYQVATGHSGEAAVSMARERRYDAILMDIRMPGLNGVEALKRIKAAAPETRVIMMTAYTRHDLVEEARQAAALAIVPKPLDVEEVLGLLERATGADSGAGEAGG